MAEGNFYIIQPWPQVMPNVCKVGYTMNLKTRTKHWKQIAPTLQVVKLYSCDRKHEIQMIRNLRQIKSYAVRKYLFYNRELLRALNIRILIRDLDRIYATVVQGKPLQIKQQRAVTPRAVTPAEMVQMQEAVNKLQFAYCEEIKE